MQVVQQAASAAQGQPAPFASGPAPFAAQPVQPAVPSPAAPAVPPAGQPVQPPVAQPEEEAAPWQAAPANPQAFAPEPSPPPAAPAAPAVPPADRTLRPFAPWPQVLEALSGRDPAMSSFLRGSGAFYDGRRVLIDCNETFRDYMRQNKETNRLLKQVILEVSGIRCGIGPYEKPQTAAASGAPPVEDTLKAMQSLGVDVVVEDK